MLSLRALSQAAFDNFLAQPSMLFFSWVIKNEVLTIKFSIIMKIMANKNDINDILQTF